MLRLFLMACLVLSAVLVSRMLVSPATDPMYENRGIYLGVWQPGAPGDMERITEFERQVGKKVAIVQFYYDWRQSLDPQFVENVVQHGALPLITWEPEDGCAQINNGSRDEDIRRWAAALAQFKGKTTILLRTMHEMNIPDYPWSVVAGGCTAEGYVQAWRRVHRLFTEAGATNVQHVWTPNVIWGEEAAFEAMFPGDAYVDWVGLDGYNWGTPDWQSFGELFWESYQRITALSRRPVMIAETASAEAGDGGRRKAAWITVALLKELPAMSRVRAVIWFNEDWEGRAFRIDSTPRAHRAFAQALAAPYYRSASAAVLLELANARSE